MPTPEETVALAVEAGAWPGEEQLRQTAVSALNAVEDTLGRDLSDQEVSILFTDDESIAALNTRWRGISSPTNVLSFPATPTRGATGEAVHLGDIVLGFETVTKEAAEAHLTLIDHITHLLVHGMLHLLGYDHEEVPAAEAMETLETEILATLGIANPYANSEPIETYDGRNS